MAMKPIKHRTRVSAIAAAGLLAGGFALSPIGHPAQAAPGDWTTTKLESLAAGQDTVVNDVNNQGFSVGSSGGKAVAWNGAGKVLALATPTGCDTSEATTINEEGEAAGWMVCPGSSFRQGIQWSSNGTPKALPRPLSIEDRSDNNVYVGQRNPDSLTNDQAFGFYEGIPRVDLETTGAASSIANAVTEYGFAVGTLHQVPGPEGTPEDIAVGWYAGTSFPLVRQNLVTEGVDVTESAYSLVQVRSSGDDRGLLVAPTGAVYNLDAAGANDEVVDVNEGGIVIGSRQLEADEDDTVGVFYYGEKSVRIDAVASDADVETYGFTNPTAINDGAWVVGSDDGVSWLLKPPAATTTTTTVPTSSTSSTVPGSSTTTTTAPGSTTSTTTAGGSTTSTTAVTGTTVEPSTSTTIPSGATTSTTVPEVIEPEALLGL